MSFETWNRMQARDDPYADAELLRTRTMQAKPKKRAGTVPEDNELVPVPHNTAARAATRRDDFTGFYISGD